MMMSKRKVAEAGGSKERWLLTYADLITLLVCFFIMMYSFAQTDLEKFKSLSLSMQQAFGGGAVTQEEGKPVSIAVPGEGGTTFVTFPTGIFPTYHTSPSSLVPLKTPSSLTSSRLSLLVPVTFIKAVSFFMIPSTLTLDCS